MVNVNDDRPGNRVEEIVLMSENVVDQAHLAVLIITPGGHLIT